MSTPADACRHITSSRYCHQPRARNRRPADEWDGDSREVGTLGGRYLRSTAMSVSVFRA